MTDLHVPSQEQSTLEVLPWTWLQLGVNWEYSCGPLSCVGEKDFVLVNQPAWLSLTIMGQSSMVGRLCFQCFIHFTDSSRTGKVSFILLHVSRYAFTRISALFMLTIVCFSRNHDAGSLDVLILFGIFSCLFKVKVVQFNMEGLSLPYCLILGRECD